MSSKVFEVSELNEYIKGLLDKDSNLRSVIVRGELSNYKVYPSGHHYFTMKDALGSLRCVMFRGAASSLRFRPDNGMKVIASGRVTVFPRDGQYQLYCETLSADGIGDLYVAFEQLRDKLFKEGLFNKQFKKPIPRYPEKIAVITSSAGAAVRDIIRVLGKRYPLAKIIVVPVRVQGSEAADEICQALAYVNRHRLADLIITGRGGGSLEDLWAFNEEIVARAIFASEIPVISAVGHEPDVTISDFVADLRAATPSNAAELASVDFSELRAVLQGYASRLYSGTVSALRARREQLTALSQNHVLTHPLSYIDDKRRLSDYMQTRLLSSYQKQLSVKKQKFFALASALDAMSPLKVLSRGYCLAQDDEGKVISSSSQAKVGENIRLQLSDGALKCLVSERIEENE